MARAGHWFGGIGAVVADPADDRRLGPASTRPDLPDLHCVPRWFGTGVDRLRLQPAIQHLVQPDRWFLARPRCARGVYRVADRSPRTGRDRLDPQTPA